MSERVWYQAVVRKVRERMAWQTKRKGKRTRRLLRLGIKSRQRKEQKEGRERRDGSQ